MKWLVLPTAFWLTFAAVHGKLVLSGTIDRPYRCVSAVVEPASRHATLRHVPCSAADRLRTSWNGRQPWTDVYVGKRLAFRYQDASDTRPVSATSGDALWIYDVDTDRGPILQRWSLATGTLQQETRFPVELWRPLLAANAAGAWLMAAGNGDENGVVHVALWHATSRGIVAVRRGPKAAVWMVARDRRLWLETTAGFHSFSLWRYDGTRGRKLWTRRRPYVLTPALGGGALWSGSEGGCGAPAAIVRIDEQTGATRTLATLPQPGCDELGPGAYLDGAFWLVDGTELYRIAG